MKKLIALLMAMTMTLSFAACGSNNADNADANAAGTESVGTETEVETEVEAAAQTDMEYVKEKGKLVVGITNFAPMDYKDETDTWVGFDADMAKAFAASLGVEVEFIEIDWGNKIAELDSKAIDCVWNGMTLTDEVTSAMSCSNAYCNNAQIVVMPADKAEQYQTVESLAELEFAVETGSAGESVATEAGLKVNAVADQASALMEVAAGSADAAVIDSLMAAAMVGEGTGYETLVYNENLKLNSEEYGVGFRQGSDLTAALNDFFKAAYADGTMMECAGTYGVDAAIIAQ